MDTLTTTYDHVCDHQCELVYCQTARRSAGQTKYIYIYPEPRIITRVSTDLALGTDFIQLKTRACLYLVNSFAAPQIIAYD